MDHCAAHPEVQQSIGEQIGYFFSYFFSTGDFPPRWHCGIWSDFHGWLYIMSDLTIWLAYFIIPVILIWFVKKRPDVPFLPVFWLFGAFIICCGATHLIDATIFWWPAYRVSAVLRLITAVVSMATVFALIRDLPKALDLKPMKKSEEKMDELRSKLDRKNAEIASLKAQIEQLK